MPKVKGSRQIQMVVVPYRPWLKTAVVTGSIMLVIAVGAGAYYWGLFESGNALAERDLLLVENRSYRQELTQLRQQAINAEQEQIMDSQALSEVRGTITSLRETIAQLEEDVLFYKQIMSPENDERGLVIGQFDLFSMAQPGRYRYRLELKQLGDSVNLVQGHANVNILGYESGEERSIPLRSVSESEDSLDISLRFQYYQNIEGELVLPEGFIPDKVQIVAVAEGGANAKTVEKSFGWVVQDNQ